MILALQYSEGDLERSMALARLLADIEPTSRCDVLLALVTDSSTPVSSLVEETTSHCEEKFPVVRATLRRAVRGWPQGPNHLWAGTMTTFSELAKEGEVRHNSIFTFDGGDGVPLHRDWIDLVAEEHARTHRIGLLVSATPGIDTINRDHVQGNMVIDLAAWDRVPSLRFCPDDDGWDCFHTPALTPHSSLSSLVRNDWRTDVVDPSLFALHARKHVWWHGIKCPEFCDRARDYLFGPGRFSPSPVLRRWDSFAQYRAWFLSEQRSSGRSWQDFPQM